MAATTTKPAYTVLRKDEENERNLRKLFFAAAADIPDQMLSNLEQPFVRIALKLLELLRAHRAAHGAGGGYAPPDVVGFLIQIVEVIPVKSKTYLKHYLH